MKKQKDPAIEQLTVFASVLYRAKLDDCFCKLKKGFYTFGCKKGNKKEQTKMSVKDAVALLEGDQKSLLENLKVKKEPKQNVKIIRKRTKKVNKVTRKRTKKIS